MRAALLAVGVVALTAAPVHADDPVAPASATPSPARELARRSDRARLYHQIAIIGLGGAYVVSEVGLKSYLAGDCRWCDPPGFDRSVRDALVWDDPDRAARIADLTGYIAAPVIAVSLLWASTWSSRTGRRWFDDSTPVLEAAIAVGVFSQVAKFGIRRARPLARFGEPGRVAELDDNTSFFSGHTSLTFAIAVAAGTVAHCRRYKLEPVIWGVGLGLATTTAYLRIAADKHYLTDVLTGAAIGSAFGYLVPRWFHADILGDNVAVVPTGNGVAITGAW